MSSMIPHRRSYYGLSSLFMGVVSVILFGAYYLITLLKITPAIFFQMNNVITLSYCIVTPIAGILAIMGLVTRDDSKPLSILSLGLVGFPFLYLLWQFFNSFLG
ncbi:MAG: hypothetical protein FJZ87_08490 [Chloroflexi bacterium]|nr:hypothetical protein [Chloroflexota bacterium]